jgi:glycine betaine/proline transport system substrate-binding protein
MLSVIIRLCTSSSIGRVLAEYLFFGTSMTRFLYDISGSIPSWGNVSNFKRLCMVFSVLFAVVLMLIGVFSLWSLMIETISIVIVSVIISVVFGFPIGIIISRSDRADRIIRPVLDGMQTMPVFVYLIPVAIFLGLGKAPAVIATTIYAIVPLIRLTNHGIRQVDTEVVEAARAFGSTELQTLYKVQIPQALPTIMTGLNQTLMMAMSMVVTCSMIGASGLGMEVLIGVNRMEIGRGVVAGTAVVIIAIILDRLTQGMVKKGEELDGSEQ